MGAICSTDDKESPRSSSQNQEKYEENGENHPKFDINSNSRWSKHNKTGN